MFSWLKKLFIPHEHNNHRPHILSSTGTRYIIILIIFFEIFSFLIPTLSKINISDQMASVLPAVLSSLTNEERQSQNLNTLNTNPLLVRAAEMKAEDMAKNGYFAHVSPEGKTPWYWIEQAGYKYQYAGENLAVNFSDSKDVTKAWMESPTHKANIVKENYTEVGTGIAVGMYKGRETVFVAQIYANPSLSTKPLSLNTEAPATPAPIVVVEQPQGVLGAEMVPVEPVSTPEPSFTQKAMSSPRNTTNSLLYLISALIALALLLYIVIRARNHHKDLITNGLMVLATIGAILAVNYHISYKDMVITQSVDYSAEDNMLN